jgi:hypothetical protein
MLPAAAWTPVVAASTTLGTICITCERICIAFSAPGASVTGSPRDCEKAGHDKTPVAFSESS